MAIRMSLARDDAVRRWRLFQAQHPDVVISARIDPTAHWVAVLSGGREIADYHLDGLLDQLDELDL